MKPSVIVRITHYKTFCLYYGLNTILTTLKYFEEIEDFEECYCILKGVEEHKKEANIFYKGWFDNDMKREANLKQVDDLIHYFDNYKV